MRTIDVVVRNRLGLHARAAAKFVHLANRYRAEVAVATESSSVNGKSILGLLTLAAASGTRLRLSAVGADADQAVQALAWLVEDGFGEGTS